MLLGVSAGLGCVCSCVELCAERRAGKVLSSAEGLLSDPYIFGSLPITVSSGITDKKLELAWWPVLLQTHMLDHFQSPRGRAVACGDSLQPGFAHV